MTMGNTTERSRRTLAEIIAELREQTAMAVAAETLVEALEEIERRSAPTVLVRPVGVPEDAVRAVVEQAAACGVALIIVPPGWSLATPSALNATREACARICENAAATAKPDVRAALFKAAIQIRAQDTDWPAAERSALALLRDLEWSGGTVDGCRCCPSCSAEPSRGQSHAQGCKLAALLAGAGRQVPPTSDPADKWIAWRGSATDFVSDMKAVIPDSKLIYIAGLIRG